MAKEKKVRSGMMMWLERLLLGKLRLSKKRKESSCPNCERCLGWKDIYVVQMGDGTMITACLWCGARLRKESYP